MLFRYDLQHVKSLHWDCLWYLKQLGIFSSKGSHHKVQETVSCGDDDEASLHNVEYVLGTSLDDAPWTMLRDSRSDAFDGDVWVVKACPMPELWVLVNFSNLLVYRSEVRLRSAVANGQDANRNWFYLRPGAVQFLRDLIETPSVRIGMVTQMKHSNCDSVLQCLSRRVFQVADWDERTSPVFGHALSQPVASGKTVGDGNPIRCTDVDAVRAYARDVLGYDLDEKRLVVLQNDLNIGVMPLGTSVISIGGFGPWDGLSSIWVVVKSSRS